MQSAARRPSVKFKIRMELVDPNKRETQRNSPAPGATREFVEELTKIAGVNRYGQPNLRLAWGQERRQWALGDPEALLYIDTRLDPIVHTRHSLRRVSHVELVPIETGDGMVMREVRHYEVEYLPDEPAVIPAGWLYACEQEMEWIGEQLWYIEQYTPPEAISGGEVRWNAERFAEGYHLRTGKFDPFLDHTGHFPREGDYESILVIGEPYIYPTYHTHYEYEFDERGEPHPTGRTAREMVPMRHMRYRELGRDVLEALREGVYERDHRQSDRRTSAQRQRDALSELEARNARRRAADRDYTRRALKDRIITAAGDRMGLYNPPVRNKPQGEIILTGE